MKPNGCDICNINVPTPWTVTIDSVFKTSFISGYKSKYPEDYSPVVIVGEEPPFEVGCACVAHYKQVKNNLEQKIKVSP